MNDRVAAALLALVVLGAAAPAFAQSPPVKLPPAPDHVVIVFMENKDYSAIIGSPDAPYINSLLAQGASLTQFHAFHHPSQPNYFEFFAGDQLGVCVDECPPKMFCEQNLASAAIAKGLTFKGYAENLPPNPTVCFGPGGYARRHCPWTYFANVPAESSVDFSTFPQTADPKTGFPSLPTISMVIPNLDHDMHDGTVQQGDAWLKQNLGNYITWAMTNNSLFILTWDEDGATYSPVSCCPGISTQRPDNRIATLLVGASVTPGSTSSTPYTHHDLLRTILDLYGIPLFAGAQSSCASDIDGIWKVQQQKRTR